MRSDTWLEDALAAVRRKSGLGAFNGADRTPFSPFSARRRRPGDALDQLPDAEIAQLVSLALEDALIALGKDEPEAFLRRRSRQARAEMHESFVSLPRPQKSNPRVVSEYHKGIVFQNFSCELAIELASTLERYARLRGPIT